MQNQLVLVLLVLCITTALVPTEGFFKTGRELRERVAASKQREVEGDYSYTDDERRAFLDALMRRAQEEQRRNKLDWTNEYGKFIGKKNDDDKEINVAVTDDGDAAPDDNDD